jgi:hypothetical protein
MLFEQASRIKLRFSLNGKGLFSTEDLWDLKLEDLDRLAKSLNKEVKEAAEESFIKAKSSASQRLELQFNIVKRVIEVKLAEKEAAQNRVIVAQRKAEIQDLINKKKSEELGNKSLEELERELEALGKD